MQQCLLIVLLLLTGVAAQSHTGFRTLELQRLAQAVPLQIPQDTSGYIYETVGGHSYVCHIANGIVDHVGLSLFSDDVKAIAKTPILDFLERYFLQLQHPGGKTVEYMLRSDQFKFQKGNLATVSQINDSDVFSFDHEMRLYHATWQRSNRIVLSVSFPQDFQLISGENKIEAEQLLEKDIKSTVVDDLQQPAVDRLQLTESHQKGFYTLLGNSYQVSKINNNLYFSGDSVKGYALVNDISHPLESATNLLLSPYASGDYMLNINQTLYGYQRKRFTVPLKKWLRLCKQQSCEVYVGIEESDNKQVKASAFAVNDDMGYVHVLVATIPLKAIDDGHGTLECRLDSYVPTANVRNLFAKYHKNKRITPRLYEQ